MDQTLIRALQTALDEFGLEPGPVDGIAGRQTKAAAAAYLASKGGAAAAPINFHGAAKRLDDIDLPNIGETIGVGEDELHAIMDVEARGSGFDSQGRPAMLLEPHVLYRLLDGAERADAVAEGLAYPKWGERSYPRDSYPRLEQAMQINEDAALRSASWGMGQIMGFNAVMCGYGSAREMVEAFCEDEEEHLFAMVRYIVAAGLDDELRRHDWEGFARGYNGPGYKTHGYHTRLGNAFLKWSRIPDTPYERV